MERLPAKRGWERKKAFESKHLIVIYGCIVLSTDHFPPTHLSLKTLGGCQPSLRWPWNIKRLMVKWLTSGQSDLTQVGLGQGPADLFLRWWIPPMHESAWFYATLWDLRFMHGRPLGVSPVCQWLSPALRLLFTLHVKRPLNFPCYHLASLVEVFPFSKCALHANISWFSDTFQTFLPKYSSVWTINNCSCSNCSPSVCQVLVSKRPSHNWGSILLSSTMGLSSFWTIHTTNVYLNPCVINARDFLTWPCLVCSITPKQNICDDVWPVRKQTLGNQRHSVLTSRLTVYRSV